MGTQTKVYAVLAFACIVAFMIWMASKSGTEQETLPFDKSGFGDEPAQHALAGDEQPAAGGTSGAPDARRSTSSDSASPGVRSPRRESPAVVTPRDARQLNNPANQPTREPTPPAVPRRAPRIVESQPAPPVTAIAAEATPEAGGEFESSAPLTELDGPAEEMSPFQPEIEVVPVEPSLDDLDARSGSTLSEMEPLTIRGPDAAEGDRAAQPPSLGGSQPLTPQPVRKKHKIAEGERLWTIAEREFGDGMYYRAIVAVNDSIKNADDIKHGMTIVLPDPAEADRLMRGDAPAPARSEPAATTRRTSQSSAGAVETLPTYTVERGDSLIKIAEKLYGDASRWKEIHELNKDQLPDPDRIRYGMKLRVPRKRSGS